MRPTARLAIDPLWQCLCPSWTGQLTARAALAQARKPALHSLKNRPQARNIKVPGQYNQFDVVLNPLHQPTQAQIDAKTLAERGPPRVEKPRKLEAFKTPDYAKESTFNLYTQMRAAAIGGRAYKCRFLAEMLVKERHERPNYQIYNALILCNTGFLQGAAWRVADLIDEMHECGLPPDVGTCHAALKALAVHPDHLVRSDILHYMEQKWFQLSNDGAHDVITGLLREGLFEQAVERLHKLQQDGEVINGWLLDIAVYIFCEAGELEEAYRIMQSRFDRGDMSITRSLWWVLLDKASAARHYEATQLVWTSQVNRDYFNPPSGICLNVLATAAGVGDAILATEVFTQLSKRGTQFKPIHYELLINAYIAASPPDLRRALSVLTVMALEQVEPATAETRSLYAYLYNKPDKVEEAIELLRELHSLGRIIPLAALNLLIECFVRQNNLFSAMKLYKQIHTFVPLVEGAKKSPANAETFNILFKGCRTARPPDAQTAAFLVSELVSLNVKPDALTFDRLILAFLAACGHAFHLARSQSAAEEAKPTESATTASAITDALSHQENTSAIAANSHDTEPSSGRLSKPYAFGLRLLNFSFQHFSDMLQLDLLPRIGTMRQLALMLAAHGDSRCWDVLQVGEDHSSRIAGWVTKSKHFRTVVERTWSSALNTEAVKGESSEYEAPQADLEGEGEGEAESQNMSF